MDFLAGWHRWFLCPSRESSPSICFTNNVLIYKYLKCAKVYFLLFSVRRACLAPQRRYMPVRQASTEAERGRARQRLRWEGRWELLSGGWTSSSSVDWPLWFSRILSKSRQPLKNACLWFVIVSAQSGVIQINDYVTMFNVVLMAMQLFSIFILFLFFIRL